MILILFSTTSFLEYYNGTLNFGLLNTIQYLSSSKGQGFKRDSFEIVWVSNVGSNIADEESIFM